MQHLDEHTLELYVLKSEKISDQVGEIEAHLNECFGCRALVEQMTNSYHDAEMWFNKFSEQSSIPSSALARSQTKPVPIHDADAKPVPSYRMVTRFEQFRHLVRRHPVMIGGGSFVAFASLALLGTLMLKSPRLMDENPAFVRYNVGSNSAEILNKESQLLWQIPSRDIAGIVESESRFRTPSTLIDDIDGDGKNEVVTALWHPADGLDPATFSVRVYDYSHKLRFKIMFEAPIRYLDRQYSDAWTADRVITMTGDVAGKKDILVNWGCGRSPEVITRVDTRGKELGQYWHFGVINGMFAVDVDGDGKKELILTGENDVLDSTRQEFPAIAVLDPKRIVGDKKSGASPGFALQESDAEAYYIRLPVSPLSTALIKHEWAMNLVQDKDGTLVFWVENGKSSADQDYAIYEYRFSRDLHVLQVKSTSQTDFLYTRKAREGLLKGTIDAAYLNALKNGVRYWDGREWRKGSGQSSTPECCDEIVTANKTMTLVCPP